MEITDHDSYLAAQPAAHRALLQRLRAQIAAAAPDAVECISYKMPAFRLPNGKVVAGYASFKRHCAYLPHSGRTLASLAASLAGYTQTQGSLHFTAANAPSDALVAALVAARRAEVDG